MFYAHSYFWANEFLQSYHSLFMISLYLESEDKTILTGNGVDLNASKCLQAAVGEYYERNFLYDFNRMISEKTYITGINMQSGKAICLSKQEIQKNGWFKDSCGLATHIWSKECILNSFNEFIERQSFVFSYLSKSPAKKVEAKIYSDFIDIPKILKKVDVYNISLSNLFYVILILVDTGEKIWLGLGSDINFEKALKKALKEVYQYLLVKKCEAFNNTTVSSNNNQNSYSRLFELLTAEQIRRAYSYLEKSEKMAWDEIKSKNVTIKDVLKELLVKYGIEPYIFFANFSDLNIKGCFICDLNWFPSMLPRDFIKKQYDFVEKATGMRLDRNCTYIPFP